jgi:hypothetical protein
MIAALEPKVMSDPAWIVKWRAREALKNGRPEEAHRLLDELLASGNRRAFALRSDVVRGYLERADKALAVEDVDAAWADLERVEQLASGDGGVARLKQTLTRLALTDIRALLEAGNPLQALQSIAQLKERPVNPPELAPLEEATQDWILAKEIAERGDFGLARNAVERIRRRLDGHSTGLDRFEQDLVRREEHFQTAWSQLTEAAEAKNFRDMLRKSEEVLAVAPRHREALEARSRAWQVVQPDTAAYTRREASPVAAQVIANPPARLEQTQDARVDATQIKRLYLWIDGVGAWLVCLNSRVTIGQSTPEGGPIDVPLFADVSRIHASLTRDDESYVLETTRDVLINDKPVSKAVLHSGDRLTIATCPMLFEQPVPGCLSAKLTPEGGRRLPMAVDGVLLMADLLVFGPGEKVHVRMPELTEPLHLFRQKDRLGVRWAGEFSVEGQKCKDRALLPAQGSVSADAFTFAIEPAPK